MLRSMIAGVLAGMVAALGLTPAAAQDAAPFIDRNAVISPAISPNGREVALIRRKDDVQQLIVIDLESAQARIVQESRNDRMGFNWVLWKGDSRLVVGATLEVVEENRPRTGTRVQTGDKEFTYRISRVFALDTDGRNVIPMFQGRLSQLAGGYGSTNILDTLPADAEHVLLSAFDDSGLGAWKADIKTGKVEQVADGDWYTFRYATDGVGYPVLRLDGDENVVRIMRRASGTVGWAKAGEFRRNVMSGTPDFAAVGSGPGPNQIYVLSRHKGDRTALHLYDSATGEFGEPIAAGADADLSASWFDPVKRQVMATCEFATRLACKAIDPSLQKYFGALDQFFDRQATVHVLNASADFNRWLLEVDMPTEGLSYYVFNRATVNVEKIADTNEDIKPAMLAPTEVVSYDARDGTKLWAYVTAKPGSGPRPTVVMPHGGPESRDYYGFDAFAQYLAGQGYVVVQPNFRGSIGSGEAFASAGYGQWGRRMQDDVTDALKHLVDAGRADPKRVCIVGASYGGYAALAGATLTPDLYRCAVSIAGVSDLEEMLRSEKSDSGQYSNVYYYWRQSIGEPGKDRVALQAVSPRRQADKVAVPVLLIHGEDDKTVPVRQSVIMQEALQAAKKSSRLIRVPKADHSWYEWDRKDRLMLFQETAAFLKQNFN